MTGDMAPAPKVDGVVCAHNSFRRNGTKPILQATVQHRTALDILSAQDVRDRAMLPVDMNSLDSLPLIPLVSLRAWLGESINHPIFYPVSEVSPCRCFFEIITVDMRLLRRCRLRKKAGACL
jgi:hypothetical protein